MSDGVPDTAAASTRLGQLQRGRGAGFRSALAAGVRAHDDVLQCVVADPRVDRQIESRARYYAELGVALDVPLAPIVQHLAGRPEELGHAVIAGAWRLGHPGARQLLAAPRTDRAIVAGIAESLWSSRWATLVELPPRAARVFLQRELEQAQCAEAARRSPQDVAEAALSVEQLLELGRDVRHELRAAVVEELCRRDGEADRRLLATVVTNDLVYGRVRLAARILATLGDERLLPLAMDYFAREDVFEDASRRLNGHERMRRSALSAYVQHLPPPRQLELARAWHARGGYFETVAGFVLREQATADDRMELETFVAARSSADDGLDIIFELEALVRIADPRSAPLLCEVAEQTSYSHARRRALHGLALMPDVPVATAALHEALWDCEDEAAADACAFLPRLDGAARERIATLASHRLTEEELCRRAVRRLQRGG